MTSRCGDEIRRLGLGLTRRLSSGHEVFSFMLLLVLRNEGKQYKPLGVRLIPTTSFLWINEQQTKDYIRGEKRILVEMRPEFPLASVRVFLNLLSQTLAERVRAGYVCMLCGLISQTIYILVTSSTSLDI